MKARQTGRAVGRVAAILNERYNRHRRESDAAAPIQGFFGFFAVGAFLTLGVAARANGSSWVVGIGVALVGRR